MSPEARLADNARSRAWHHSHPEEAKLSRIKCRNKKYHFVNCYLRDKGCTDCPTHDIRVLIFDHVRGIKKFNVSHAIRISWQALIEEMDKCEVRCANCHLIRHPRRISNV